ncbi:Vacuolar protein sorting-associated protein ist1 [Saitoella coloradoensis]
MSTSTVDPILARKLKVQFKLSIERLRLLQKKRTAIAKQQRRELALLLEAGKEESAKIRVEGVIRNDVEVELMEILELFCELCVARYGLIEQKGPCDPGLEEAIVTLIYTAPRMSDVKELQTTRDLLGARYGRDFALAAAGNTEHKVNEKVLHKLRVDPPELGLVQRYLKEIARAYGIKWGEDSDESDGDDGGAQMKELEKQVEGEVKEFELRLPSTPGAKGIKVGEAPIQVTPQSPTSENPRPHLNLPGGRKASIGASPRRPSTSSPAKKEEKGSGIPDFDDLQARFERLKKL